MSESAALASRERIAKWQEETKITIAEINARVQDSQKRLEMENENWQHLHSLSNEAGTEAANRQHEAGQAELDRQAALAQEQQTQEEPVPVG